MTTNQQTSVAR